MIRPKVNLISLGCSKNLVDSEKILASVTQKGGIVCENRENADVVVINTCGFINSAKEESIDSILQIADLKAHGKCKKLIVTGCLAQRYKSELQKEIPEIDHVIGLNKFDKIADKIFFKRNGLNHKTAKSTDNDLSLKTSAGLIEDKKRLPLVNDRQRSSFNKRISLTPKHYAYLKISEGCNNRCTYCTIPYIRGRYKSRPIEEILIEAQSLAANGVKEINIIAQDTTAYGYDLYKEQKLHTLLKKISEIKSVKWIRLLYTHPGRIYNELIDEIALNKKICNYIDLPIQHINDEILKMMGRGTTRLHISRLIDNLRSRIPGLALRTSVIVGFPGETEKQFEELIDFIEVTCFQRLGAFAYSKEDSTPASSFKNSISKKVKNERYETLMAVQQRIMFENNEKMIGKKLKVLIDSCDVLGKNKIKEANKQQSAIPNHAWVGRCYADAPEVDGNVLVYTKRQIRPGTFKDVIVNGADGYNLIGVLTN